MTVAITPRTIYDGKDLSSGYTWNVDLTNTYFYGCNLSGVDLSNVTSFKGCEFWWCNMTGTKFTNLDLRNLNFGAGPTLQWCNLTSADFTGATLTNVNLTGNTLNGLIVSGAELTGTVGLVGVSVVTAIPLIVSTMTANNAPSPRVVTSTTTYPGIDAYLAFDGSVDTYTVLDNAGGPWFLEMDFGSGHAHVVTKYAITIKAPADTTSRAPLQWTFQGSNNGSTWTTLDTQTVISWTSGTAKPFTFSSSTAYRYFKFNVTVNGGSQYMDISEFAFYGT